MRVSAVQQSESALCVHVSPPSLTSLPFPHPTPEVITEPRAKQSVLYSSFPPAIQLMHRSIYVSMPTSQFSPLSPLPSVSSCLFMSASLSLPCKQVHWYHFPSASNMSFISNENCIHLVKSSSDSKNVTLQKNVLSQVILDATFSSYSVSTHVCQTIILSPLLILNTFPAAWHP